jgi:SSS family solute:Na+ symporter
MQTLDYVVLGGYFLTLILIGIISSLRIKGQEDYFMGGRGFGKLMQTFAAFGAGTGANDPIQTGRTVWTSGLSGIWSVFIWLFVTPFYWFFAVWYRRMRHLTLGDWFVERYQSRSLGVAYTIFAFFFYAIYLSIMFIAISKASIPLIGEDGIATLGLSNPADLRYILIPAIAVIVVGYGVLGGLTAAYWTDLIQGLCIIALSILLIPAGLSLLADEATTGKAANAETTTVSVNKMLTGAEEMHRRLPEDYFNIFSGPGAGEFPLHFIIIFTLQALLGIVVQPHFIATGGGSAKTENSARIGLVTGNFLKRFCTIGWALTGLIVLALLADRVAAACDPDIVWGLATREILGPMNLGLVGLMLACLLAALMSSADAYMLVFSGLMVRNVYAAYVEKDATEARYVLVGRITGVLMIAAAVVFALTINNVFQQFKAALDFALVFVAPFWLGMFWRWANKWSAWLTVVCTLLVFYALPYALPAAIPSLTTNVALQETNQIVETVTLRKATRADVEKWMSWEQATEDAKEVKSADKRDAELQSLAKVKPVQATKVGEEIKIVKTSQPKAYFWETTRFAEGRGRQIGQPNETRNADGHSVTTTIYEAAEVESVGGAFQLEFLPYYWAGISLHTADKPMLETLRIIPRMIFPLALMVLLSLITPKDKEAELDRYYAKMRTPVAADPKQDSENLKTAYEQAANQPRQPLGLELRRPTLYGTLGFVVCLCICFAFVAIAWWIARIGS